MNINPETLVIGFDIGGTTMTAGLVDGRLRLLESLEVKTPVESQDALLAEILRVIERLRSHAPSPVAAVGFGIPSMIDQIKGRAVMSVNIPLADFDFVAYMREQLKLPVFIDNDANVAALAEAQAGAAAGAKEVIMITMGTGIGGGIVTGGSVYRGATGSAAELGHMVIDVNGPKCPGACENYGCFEAMASGTALKRYAAEIAKEEPGSKLAQAAADGLVLNGALVFALVQDGDAAAKKVFDRVGFYVGVGMTSLINIFNPEVFVIGGGLIKAGDLIMAPAKKVLAARGLRPNRDVVRVVEAKFGPDAGLIGAACMALSELQNL